MAVNVSLDWYELQQAASIGCMRQIEALRKGVNERFVGSPMDENAWQIHIVGACGELALSKYLGTYYSMSVNTFKSAADIGYNIEVRTRQKHNYDLIVRADDKNESIMVLVTGNYNLYRLHGWIRAVDAKQTKWTQNYGGYGAAYFIPQSELNPIDKLKDMLILAKVGLHDNTAS